MIVRHLATLFIVIFITACSLHGQESVQEPEQEAEKLWVISAGGGAVVPMRPDYFAGQWKTGYTITASLEYLLTPSVAFGGSFDRSVFAHTGKSLRFRDQPFQCLGGGTRSFTTAGIRMRFYVNDDSPFRFSIGCGAGVMHILREDVSYHHSGFTIVIPSESSLHIAGMATAGIEFPVISNLTAALEGGYGIAEDGVWINHYIPVTASLRLRL